MIVDALVMVVAVATLASGDPCCCKIRIRVKQGHNPMYAALYVNDVLTYGYIGSGFNLKEIVNTGYPSSCTALSHRHFGSSRTLVESRGFHNSTPSASSRR